jgi:Cobalamin biosynthesis protein CbiG
MARRDARDAMGMGEAVIVAGIGCRKGASPAEIEAVIAAALERAGFAQDKLGAIATPADKGDEAGIAAVALLYGLPLLFVPTPDLEAAAARCETRSERALAHKGVPSVAEAAALAAGDPDAKLLLPRVAVGPATCALAETGSAP